MTKAVEGRLLFNTRDMRVLVSDRQSAAGQGTEIHETESRRTRNDFMYMNLAGCAAAVCDIIWYINIASSQLGLHTRTTKNPSPFFIDVRRDEEMEDPVSR